MTAPYLRKVLSPLRDAGIVQTRRGSGGGVSLDADPAKLTVLQVVEAIEPVPRIERCPLGIPGHTSLCPLHAQLDETLRGVRYALANTFVSSLVGNSGDDVLHCAFPSSS